MTFTIEVECWLITESRRVVGRVDPESLTEWRFQKKGTKYGDEFRITEMYGGYQLTYPVSKALGNERDVNAYLLDACAGGDAQLADEYFTCERIAEAFSEKADAMSDDPMGWPDP